VQLLLNRSFYGPFKKFVNRTSEAWIRNNTGKTMPVYDIPFIMSRSLPNALTPENIKRGFSVTGVWPFNSDDIQKSTILVVSTSNSGVNIDPSSSSLNAVPSTSEGNEHHISPVDIRLSPKADVRKETRKRISRETVILTL
jgi:hypothetical protein